MKLNTKPISITKLIELFKNNRKNLAADYRKKLSVATVTATTAIQETGTAASITPVALEEDLTTYLSLLVKKLMESVKNFSIPNM